MDEKNTQGTLNVNDILSALDSLQERHMNLLNDMQGDVGNSEILESQKTEMTISSAHMPDSDIPSEDELDAFIKEIDLYLNLPEPLEKTKSMPPEKPGEDAKNVCSFLENKTSSSDMLLPPLEISAVNPHKSTRGEFFSSDAPNKHGKKISRFISSTLFYGLIIFLIVSAFLISQGNKKSILGYYFMNVLTWSMESDIPQGSMVIVKRVDPGIIKIGDDITYMKDENTSVTHRVIGITENYNNSGNRGFETQGVENDKPDFDIVPAINVVGVVNFHIPKLGNWLEWLRDHLIVSLVFTVGFILLIVLVKGALKKNPEETKHSYRETRRLQAIK